MFSVAVYQKKERSDLFWTTLGLGKHTVVRNGRAPLKLQQGIVADLKKVIEKLPPREVLPFHVPRGIKLERLRLELSLKGAKKKRKVAGLYPIILVPRWTTAEKRMVQAFHPYRQEEWFPVREDAPIEDQAALFFGKAWADLEEIELENLLSNRKEIIKSIAFNAEPKSLLDQLPRKKKGLWDYLEPDRRDGQERKAAPVLPLIGADQTPRALAGHLSLGMPRAQLREQLHLMLSGARKRSMILVGAPGVGKSTVIHRWIHDQAIADGFETHRNLDLVHEVWQVAGKRIIAGMSYLGDWEQRCVDLLAEVKKKKRIVLWVEDLHAFGRIGRARDSDRNLADFFRGPVARGEITMIAECTPEQLQRLEDEAPSFAALFTRVHVPPTTPSETLRMMIHEARYLESQHKLSFEALSFRTVLELGGSLFPGTAFPGKALDLMRRLAKSAEGTAEAPAVVAPDTVIAHLSKVTGLPRMILEPDRKLDPAELSAELSRQVMGQPEAIGAACDLILRIRAGLTDPRRPYGVYLFTGPTGTGKTELATCIAAYLYGGASRLLRFDMSELGTPDAAARLIGDQWSPEGMLTRAIQEQPFCVVLLDEIDKAHPSVLNLLLQLFEDGRLTDAAGTPADFTHAVVIMTSNLGARTRAAIGFGEAPDAVLHDVARAVREFFPPELFNRIDRVVSFAPLTAAVAMKIAEKEVSRLLGRRGLTERNIFVQTTPAVLEKIVREGFDPREGARPVKRYLDDRVGSKLGDQITEGLPASMQIFRVYAGGASVSGVPGEIRLHVEPLREAALVEGGVTLESLAAKSTRELQAELPRALSELVELIESERLDDLEERMGWHLGQHNLGNAEHADYVYSIELLRRELDTLRERVESLLEAQVQDDPELFEAGKFSFVERGYERQRQFDVRAMTPRQARATKNDMLRTHAELAFLRRAFDHVADPGQHSIHLDLLRVGQTAQKERFQRAPSGLLERLFEAYAGARGEVEAAAAQLLTGEVISGEVEKVAEAALKSGAEHAVMRVVGLSVLDFFHGEHGCHIRHSLASGPELVRVAVTPAPAGLEPVDVVRRHGPLRAEFERSLDSGVSPLPPNPDALLPAVRTLRFDLPEAGAALLDVEVEDYRLGQHTTFRVRSLADALRWLWLARMSTFRRPA